MKDNQQTYDVTAYTTPQLVEWYIKLRDYRTELKSSIKDADAQAVQTMQGIEGELMKRLAQEDLESAKTSHGTVSKTTKHSFTVTDKHAFREWIVANPEIGVNLITAAISPAELRVYLEENPTAQIPDGVASTTALELTIRRA